MLPSEFKQLWEEMANEAFVDGFGDYLDNPETLRQLVSIVFTSMNDSLMKTQENIIEAIAKILNLTEYEKLGKDYLLPLFK